MDFLKLSNVRYVKNYDFENHFNLQGNSQPCTEHYSIEPSCGPREKLRMNLKWYLSLYSEARIQPPHSNYCRYYPQIKCELNHSLHHGNHGSIINIWLHKRPSLWGTPIKNLWSSSRAADIHWKRKKDFQPTERPRLGKSQRGIFIRHCYKDEWWVITSDRTPVIPFINVRYKYV